MHALRRSVVAPLSVAATSAVELPAVCTRGYVSYRVLRATTPSLPRGVVAGARGTCRPLGASWLSPVRTFASATAKPTVGDTLRFGQLAGSESRDGQSATGAAAFTPASFAGRVVLVVNTAALCGFTPQLRDMQALHAKYNDAGLTVLGVPCNDFGAQEPWEEPRVRKFYEEVYCTVITMSPGGGGGGENPVSRNWCRFDCVCRCAWCR